MNSIVFRESIGTIRDGFENAINFMLESKGGFWTSSLIPGECSLLLFLSFQKKLDFSHRATPELGV
jgi:hypothetical protein